MSKLEEALQEKISILEDEKEEYADAIECIEVKLETYRELLAEETSEAAPKKRGRGRPKKAATKAPAKKRGRPRKKSPEDEKNKQLYDEAVNSLPDGSTGTTTEQHERALRRFNPTPRGDIGQPGVNVGSTKGKPPAPNEKPDPSGHKTISMDDDLPEEE